MGRRSEMIVYRIFDKKLDQNVDLEPRMTTKKRATEALRRMQEQRHKYFLGSTNDLEIRRFDWKLR